MQKLLLGIVLLLPLLCGCENSYGLSEEQTTTANVITRSVPSGLEVDNRIIFLQSGADQQAGKLSIVTNSPKLTLKWNVSELSNLDTSVTNLDVVNGSATLDINWAKKLVDGNYAPKAIAFTSGVRISDGTDSVYVHLVLTTEPYLVEFNYLLDIPVSVTPPPCSIQIIPQEIIMTDNEGGVAQVRFVGTTPALVESYRIGSFTKIDPSLIPETIEEGDYGEIPFQWRNGHPNSNFRVKYYVLSFDTALRAEGSVAYIKPM